MAQVLIRNIPDDVVDRFKTKSRLRGVSLEQTLRDLIVNHAPFGAEERMALTEEFHAACRQPVQPLSKEEMREGLE